MSTKTEGDLTRVLTLLQKSRKGKMTQQEYTECQSLQTELSKKLEALNEKAQNGAISEDEASLRNHLIKTANEWGTQIENPMRFNPKRVNIKEAKSPKSNGSSSKTKTESGDEQKKKGEGGHGEGADGGEKHARRPEGKGENGEHGDDEPTPFVYDSWNLDGFMSGDRLAYNSPFGPKPTTGEEREVDLVWAEMKKRAKEAIKNLMKRSGKATPDANAKSRFSSFWDVAKEAGTKVSTFWGDAKRRYEESKIRRDMAQEAEHNHGLDKYDGKKEPIEPSVIQVGAYTRVKNGKQEHVKGYTRDRRR